MTVFQELHVFDSTSVPFSHMGSHTKRLAASCCSAAILSCVQDRMVRPHSRFSSATLARQARYAGLDTGTSRYMATINGPSPLSALGGLLSKPGDSDLYIINRARVLPLREQTLIFHLALGHHLLKHLAEWRHMRHKSLKSLTVQRQDIDIG